jgi:hypothetical protein
MNSTDIEGMTGTQLSAIAQQVVDMQNQDDEDEHEVVPGTRSNRTSTTPSNLEEGPTTPIKSSRPIRESTSRSRNYSSLLPEDPESSQKAKSKTKSNDKSRAEKVGTVKKRKSTKPMKVKNQSKPNRRRTNNGRVSMTARPLGRSDGRKRGEGVWPAKGQNTVKGNMVRLVTTTLFSSEVLIR